MYKIKLFIAFCLANFFVLSANSASNWPFQSAIALKDTLYLSGKMGLDYSQGKMVKGGIKAETKQTMQNIKGTLEENGYTMNNLVKCLIMLADISEWDEMNDVYKSFFPNGHYPTRSAFATSGLALNARVEIECLAVKSYHLNKKSKIP